MKTTRRILLASNRQLKAQLDAIIGEPRKALRARLAAMTEENKNLLSTANTLREQVTKLQGTILEMQIKATQTAKTAETASDAIAEPSRDPVAIDAPAKKVAKKTKAKTTTEA